MNQPRMNNDRPRFIGVLSREPWLKRVLWRLTARFRRKWSPFGPDGRLRPDLVDEGWTSVGALVED